MPGCWLPCPVNMNATARACRGAPHQGRVLRPAARAASPARTCWPVPARTAAVREVGAGGRPGSRPTSAGDGPGGSPASRRSRAAASRPPPGCGRDSRAGRAPVRGRVSAGSAAGSGSGCLLQDEVGVGAADAERGDAGPAGAAGVRPGRGLGQQPDLPGLPVHVRGRLLHVQGLGQERRAAWPVIILMTPATPAAAWVWPMLDLTEPSHSGCLRAGPARRWRAGPGPRSGRRGWCRCRALRPRRRRPGQARPRPGRR